MASHATRKSLAMGPSVRNLLSHYQLDPGRIQSTGPHQTLLKGDVQAYISQHNLQPVANLGHKHQQQAAQTQQQQQQRAKPKVFTPNLDISGHQPKAGPEGFSKIAKELLGETK